ncbi:RhoGEF domain-containing protein [Calycina marina]|uniref:RhoGEF domain-containing protein n=1 Tax=Calycina marina TaxID=1763456 RepID=A0A9P8CHN7_9HELO|nr:RhoGEF domain-containing protein [Calycina marina]
MLQQFSWSYISPLLGLPSKIMSHFETSITDAFVVGSSVSQAKSSQVPQKTSWGTLVPPTPSPLAYHLGLQQPNGIFDDVHWSPLAKDNSKQPLELLGSKIPLPNSKLSLVSIEGTAKCDTIVSGTSASTDRPSGDIQTLVDLGLSFNSAECAEATLQTSKTRIPLSDSESEIDIATSQRPDNHAKQPFNRWLRNLQKRRMTVNGPLDSVEKSFLETSERPQRSHHQKTSSESSSGFVTAVKSATISLASFSIAPHSRQTGVSSRNKADRSSRASNAGRQSEDSSFFARGVVADQGVTNRLIQRRQVIEELIATEENYVADIKFLKQVYVNLMGSMPSCTPKLRSSINMNLNEIIALHEELLGDLHRIVPYSEYTQADCIAERRLPAPFHGHNRWRSLDAVPETPRGAAPLHKIPGMTTEPSVAAEVAKALGKKINRFFVYEEYGAKYEIMLKDVTTTYRSTPQWNDFEAGLEALATTLASITTQNTVSKKALTIGDLLVKPLQRVCKYPLLFGELLKQTPVCDCPDSHMEIENVLIRIREATSEINKATDDSRMKAAIEKSWILQDRLYFSGMAEARSRTCIRGLGHIDLCGVLYATWQTKNGVEGQYLICLLYRDFLLLASAVKSEQMYAIQACIDIKELRVEEVDNGRGLQCHTAPFSWKLVFEHNHQLFELTMIACSAKEQVAWRKSLIDHMFKASFNIGEGASLGALSLNIKPMGTVFGKPGTIARRMSIHRATTVGQMSGLCQVVVKNTTAAREIGSSASSASINRSQSLLTSKRIPVLAPFRGERIRLESLLADVWTRDILLYPGMIGRSRGDVRTSASSIMRKLSVASIASNFTKRSSSSMAGSNRASADDELHCGSSYANQITNRAEPGSGESASIPDDHYLDPARARLESIDKDEALRVVEQAGVTLNGLPGYSNGTARRMATLRFKPDQRSDGLKMIVPPVRTSSTNSVSQSRNSSATTITGKADDDSGKENSPATSDPDLHMQAKLGKGKIRKAHGLRHLFR